MAVRIKLSSIPKESHEEIMRDLIVTPIDVQLETMKKRGQISGYVPKTDTSFSVYHIETRNLGQGPMKYIRVPYRYAQERFKRNNDHLDHREIPGIPDLVKYKATLRDTPTQGNDKSQVEIAIDCLKQLDSTGGTIIGLPPGSGKTYIGSWLAYHLGLMTIALAPRSTLIASWYTTFSTAMPDAKIWVVGENDSDFNYNPRDLDSQYDMGIPDIIICLDPRVEKIPEFIREMIGTMIIDEAHMLATPSRVKALLSIFPRYVILETATLIRDDGLHEICHLIAGSDGIFEVAKVPYTVYDVQLPFIQVKEIQGAMGVSYPALCSALAEHELYNAVIVGIIKNNLDRKFIVLTRLIEHGKLLKKLLIEEGIECDTFMGNQKSYKDSHVLIGTFSKIGVGFDEATACKDFKGRKSDSIIMAHSVKKPSNFEQFRGRVMRVADPIVYWLTPNHRMIKSHLRDLRAHIASTSGVIEVVDGMEFI